MPQQLFNREAGNAGWGVASCNVHIDLEIGKSYALQLQKPIPAIVDAGVYLYLSINLLTLYFLKDVLDDSFKEMIINSIVFIQPAYSERKIYVSDVVLSAI